jgi:thiosulfate dehydrogenase
MDEPQGTHPSYPKAGKKTGAGTWRCKECHGWDYEAQEAEEAEEAEEEKVEAIEASRDQPGPIPRRGCLDLGEEPTL